MIIGIVQMGIEWVDIYRNMNKIEEFVKEAHDKNVELLLFPEMSLTGFTMDISKHILLGKDIVNWLIRIASGYDISIGLGFGSIVDEKGFRSLAPKTLTLAEYEGFPAHARALSYRLDDLD